eukprot:CAMPEP_0172504352 /NCGR_PEP_ID=MMETSP1066-20121228/177904_1 /TAXON_ID=671091 /ORGANISM="Coscinodiscus wailesii, Strain CCMP2513" /LENGTH=149 /DNA_ID=CAMNT_0013280509 /DNA_START=69 /DNA_END=515 /DNA_ORIENTATION=-
MKIAAFAILTVVEVVATFEIGDLPRSQVKRDHVRVEDILKDIEELTAELKQEEKTVQVLTEINETNVRGNIPGYQIFSQTDNCNDGGFLTVEECDSYATASEQSLWCPLDANGNCGYWGNSNLPKGCYESKTFQAQGVIFWNANGEDYD